MSASVIQAKYDTLDSIAASFGRHAEMSADLESRVKQGFQALEGGGWEGKGSAAFFAEMNGKLFPAMQRLSHVLGDARAVMLEVKEIILKAEAEAAAIFGNKGNKGNNSNVDNALNSFMLFDKFTTVIPQRSGLAGKLSKVLRQIDKDIKDYGKYGKTKVISAIIVDALIAIPKEVFSNPKLGGGIPGKALDIADYWLDNNYHYRDKAINGLEFLIFKVDHAIDSAISAIQGIHF